MAARWNFPRWIMIIVLLLLIFCFELKDPAAQQMSGFSGDNLRNLQAQLQSVQNEIARINGAIRNLETRRLRCVSDMQQSCADIDQQISQLREQISNQQQNRIAIQAQIREERLRIQEQKASAPARSRTARPAAPRSHSADLESFRLPGQRSFYLAHGDTKSIAVDVPCSESNSEFGYVFLKIDAGGPVVITILAKNFRLNEKSPGSFERALARCSLALCGCKNDFSNATQPVTIRVANLIDKKYNSVTVSASWR